MAAAVNAVVEAAAALNREKFFIIHKEDVFKDTLRNLVDKTGGVAEAAAALQAGAAPAALSQVVEASVGICLPIPLEVDDEDAGRAVQRVSGVIRYCRWH